MKRKITSRHLPHGSGDVGLYEGTAPVHEVQEGLGIHPRGHRAAAEAGGGAADGVECRSAAKGMTEPAAGLADRSPGHFAGRRRLGPRRPTSGARPFDGTTGGKGDTRDLTGMSWLGLAGIHGTCSCLRWSRLSGDEDRARPLATWKMNRTARPDHARGSSDPMCRPPLYAGDRARFALTGKVCAHSRYRRVRCWSIINGSSRGDLP